MNDQQIYTMMAATPRIRAVQIADALGQELTEVSKALRLLVEIGDVVRTSGTTPEGSPTQYYDLSEQFWCSREGIALAAANDQTAATEVLTAAPAAAPLEIPTLITLQDPAVQPVEPGRAARALTYIAEHGSATDVQLRVVMGLPDDVFPSSYLSKDAQAGRVVKVDREWKLGDGRPLRPLSRQPAFGAPLGLPGASPFDVPAPPPPAPKVRRQVVTPDPAEVPAPAPVTRAPAAPALRCGVWLDGTFELRRGDVTTELTQAEALVLRDFLNRVLPEVVT
jgi:hypothetical protein